MIVNKKIRILTVIRHPVGGIRTYIKYTYGHLDNNKYHFTILAVKNAEGDLIKGDLEGFNVKIIEVDGKYLEFSLLYKVFDTLRKNKFDVIHSQGFTAGILTVIASIFSRTPHIITSHDVFREDQFPPRTAFLKKTLLGLLLNHADIIQSVTCDAQENLKSFIPGLSRNKLLVINNGIPVENHISKEKDSDLSLRKEIDVDRDTFLFGFLGRFMPQKGFVFLIDAVEKLSRDKESSRKFKILAVNDGAFIREYKAIIMKNGLSDYFIFYGFTPHIEKIMFELDAIIMPSLWEACGLVAMESFVAGCPIIATECIGLREVIANTPAVTIKQIADSTSIAEALKTFMDKSDMIKSEVLDFIPIAKERFDVVHTVVELDLLFNKVIRRQYAQ